MSKRFHPISGLIGGLWLGLAQSVTGQAQPNPPAVAARIVEVRGTGVQVSRQPGVWDSLGTNRDLYAGNLLKTDEHSQALVRFSDLETVRLDERSSLRIREPVGKKRGFDFLKGLLYFFHRDRPDEFEVNTPRMSAIIRGTEFTLEVSEEDGTSTLKLLEGEVTLSNAFGQPLELMNGEQGIVAPGQAPFKTPMLQPASAIQWCLYYPAVLDPEEANLSAEARQILARSLAAYQQGDLVAALAAYPRERQPEFDEERVYLAELLLSFGKVREARPLLDAVRPGSQPNARPAELASALRTIVSVVEGQPILSTLNPQLSTCLLAESYRQQSLTNLPAALAAARQAVQVSPNFSFAWARLGELEFSFDRTHATRKAVEMSLKLAPRNAQAHALHGFVLAAENRIEEALAAFERAIAIDPALANGWLGRGLCRIKQGRAESGRLDLQIAAMVEPNRALLRSYLGKAFANAGDNTQAEKELELAKKLDPYDPTGWLYSALLKQQQNRVNEAISDIEASQERNDNRALFRSRLQLDEDRAIRSANLASIYRAAGMTDVSVREAARAVTYDYANDSAHLFLSDSYNELRDPTRFNLRYETVWFNELLLANLLAPVGAGRLSPNVSQQEYSRLFQADSLGFANSTVGRSDKSFTQLASQFGTFGGTSYSLDLDYETHKGVRPNNDLDSIEWYSTVKQQITPQDTALVLVKYEDYHSGNNFQYYDPANPTNARPHFRFDEYQHPIAMAGWHHQWAPGIHTLLLGGRLENEQHFSDLAVPQLLFTEFSNGDIASQVPGAFDVDYHNTLEIYTAELNQIFQWNRITLSAGGRYQFGTFRAQARMDNPSGQPPIFFESNPGTPTNSASTDDFERFTGYGYLTVEPLDSLWLTGGLAYDDLTYPHNFRNPPLSSGEDHRSQLGPKAAFVWNPLQQATVRGVFTRSLGGVSLDESFRLEQTQLAGFPQTFRTLISESVVGSVAAPEYETFGLALDLKFPSRTYVGIQAERLESDVTRTIGMFSLPAGKPPFTTNSTCERLDYRENALSASLNQLLGDTFVVGAGYKFSQVELDDRLPAIPVSALPTPPQTMRADLHQATGYILYNHPSGFFARAESHWYHQHNSGYTPALPGDDFFQHNLFAGYRFAHRHAELTLGILNLNDQDYHLNPLTVYAELPRERTFMVRLNFEF